MNSVLEHRRSLFWDIAEETIPSVLAHSPAWVVHRVFEYGSIADIDAVITLYGPEKVKDMLRSSPMKPVTRSMAFLFLEFDPQGYYAV
ncbi:MAG: hypothetical protein HRU69_05040 [Flammeovirgaceae bacterium]|nr:MAG: hypothetical protein HRU69_05040 [Flammeovirgaceae bacterium]